MRARTSWLTILYLLFYQNIRSRGQHCCSDNDIWNTGMFPIIFVGWNWFENEWYPVVRRLHGIACFFVRADHQLDFLSDNIFSSTDKTVTFLIDIYLSVTEALLKKNCVNWPTWSGSHSLGLMTEVILQARIPARVAVARSMDALTFYFNPATDSSIVTTV